MASPAPTGRSPSPLHHAQHRPEHAGEEELTHLHVRLTELEERVFSTVLDACKFHGLTTTIRVAGGWVRDKLLGLESEDIDLALDNMQGSEFAVKVNEYLAHKGAEVHHIGVIKSNPEQSKHLETATFKLCGVDIDANNLRTEVYTGDSRIPEVQLGSPAEDAQRRDFTANALFFNIHTRQVEDLTGMGLWDLEHKWLRTPLPPLRTFDDDPLRVLRAVRFAHRFGFTVHEDVVSAATQPNIAHSLNTKVSRERIGIEVSKMLKCDRRETGAVASIVQWRLAPTVFELPALAERDPNVEQEPLFPQLPQQEQQQQQQGQSPASPSPEPRQDDFYAQGLRAMVMMHKALEDQQCGDGDGIVLEGHMRPALLTAAFLCCAHGYRVQSAKRKDQVPVAQYVVRSSLRLSTRFSEDVATLLTFAGVFVSNALTHSGFLLGNGGQANDADADEEGTLRVSVGASLSLGLGDQWQVGMMLARVLCAWRVQGGEQQQHAYAAMDALDTWVRTRSGLIGCWAWRPLVDGKEISRLCGVKGKAVGAVIAAQKEWRLRRPGASREECLEWLKTHGAK